MKHVLITGSSRGIGLALTNAFLQSGCRVTATCRNPDGARDLWELESQHGDDLKLHALDIGDAASRSALAKHLGDDHIDILINNAGIYPRSSSFPEVRREELQQGIDINLYGTMFTTQALLPHLQRAPKPVVANMTSKMGSVADNTSGGSYAYRISKAALNMFNKSFANDYPGITSIVLHPGWVQTDMGGPNALIDVVTSANGLRDVILGAGSSESGRFFAYDGKEISW